MFVDAYRKNPVKVPDGYRIILNIHVCKSKPLLGKVAVFSVHADERFYITVDNNPLSSDFISELLHSSFVPDKNGSYGAISTSAYVFEAIISYL